MSWKSPIGMAIERAVEEATKSQEEVIVKYVCHFIPTVDKEELIKALEYDRGQYEKGYADGRLDAMQRIVRCKDCKWAKPTTPWNNGKPYVPDGKYICTVEGIGYGLRYRVDADFCSLAERREE